MIQSYDSYDVSIYIHIIYIRVYLQLFHIMSMMSTLSIVHIFSQFVQLDYRASMSYDWSIPKACEPWNWNKNENCTCPYLNYILYVYVRKYASIYQYTYMICILCTHGLQPAVRPPFLAACLVSQWNAPGIGRVDPKKGVCNVDGSWPQLCNESQSGKGCVPSRILLSGSEPEGTNTRHELWQDRDTLPQQRRPNVLTYHRFTFFIMGFSKVCSMMFYVHSWNPDDMMILHSQTGTAHLRSNKKKRAAISERKASSSADWRSAASCNCHMSMKIGLTVWPPVLSFTDPQHEATCTKPHGCHKPLPHLYNWLSQITVYITTQYLMDIRYYPIIHTLLLPKNHALKKHILNERSDQRTNRGRPISFVHVFNRSAFSWSTSFRFADSAASSGFHIWLTILQNTEFSRKWWMYYMIKLRKK